MEGRKAELTLVVGYTPRWFTCPHTVTHPGTNQSRCRVTLLTEHNVLSLHHATNPNKADQALQQ